MDGNVVNSIEIREETDHYESNSIVEEACIPELEVIEEEVLSDDGCTEETTFGEAHIASDERDILDQIRQCMGGGECWDGIAFKRVERKKLKMYIERAKRVIKYIDTNDRTEVNSLIVADSVWIAKELSI